MGNSSVSVKKYYPYTIPYSIDVEHCEPLIMGTVCKSNDAWTIASATTRSYSAMKLVSIYRSPGARNGLSLTIALQTGDL